MAHESSTAHEADPDDAARRGVADRHPDLEPDWFEDGVEGFRGGGS